MTEKQRKLLETYNHLTELQIKHLIDVNKTIAADASSTVARYTKLLKLRNKHGIEG